MDTNPVQIISRDYCLPHPIDLTIIRKVFNSKDDFHIVDGNDNLIFKVTSKFWSYKKVLVDAAGNPIIKLKPKALSLHSRWKAFRGEISKPQDLIFSTKISSDFQLNTKLNVYLANNASENVCDYKVEGSWIEKSCVIYVGESSNVVAQSKKNNSLGKDKFMVTVNPNIDYAFIVALIIILHAINTQSGADASSSADVFSFVDASSSAASMAM